MELDGNAAGGILGEIFALEITASTSCCAGCGAVEPVAALTVYVDAPGTVVRCPHCGAVLIRIVHARGRYWLDLTGVRYLELRAGK